MARTTVVAPVITADGRVHRNRGCRRAISKDLLSTSSTVVHFAACTYCKPSEDLQTTAVETYLHPERPADSVESDPASAVSSYPGDSVDADAFLTDEDRFGPQDADLPDVTLDQAVADGPPALTSLGLSIRAARRDGATIAELALRHSMTAKEVRVVCQGVEPVKAEPKARARKAPKAPAAPVAKGTGSRPRKDLPPVTTADLDVMLAARAAGTSWRGVEALVPHLHRSSSPIRKLVLAEAARRGVTA